MQTAGIAAVVVLRRAKPHPNRDFAHGPVVWQIGGFGLFLLGIGPLPIIWELCAGGARRRIGVRRRRHLPFAHASHVHLSYPECPQANSGKDFTSHVISM